MKTMQGAFFFACSNMSRTRLAPTPTNISTKSEPEMVKNGTLASPAIERALIPLLDLDLDILFAELAGQLRMVARCHSGELLPALCDRDNLVALVRRRLAEPVRYLLVELGVADLARSLVRARDLKHIEQG